MDAPAVRERTGRRATAGGSRSTRHDRGQDRRTALSSLAAELSAAAATIADDLLAAPVAAVAVAEVEPAVRHDAEASPEPARLDVVLTGRREAIPSWEGEPVPVTATAQAAATPPATATPQAAAATADAPEHLDADQLRAMVQLEAARAEADILSTRFEVESAARAAAERRLAEAQDELRFLRAEVQMAGHTKRRSAGRVRRVLRTLTGRRRPVVPANNPKKERLGI